MGDFIVKYEYAAQESDELDLKVGDLITNAVAKIEGWMEGQLRGKVGMFPGNFVTKIETPSSSTATAISPVSSQTRTPTHNVNKKIFKVWSQYLPQAKDELRLEIGDEVEFISEEEEGWWRGKIRNQVGLLPSNFVKEIYPKEKAAQNSTARQTSEQSSGTNPVVQIQSSETSEIISIGTNQAQILDQDGTSNNRKYKACYSYSPENKDELKLQVGDEIEFMAEVEDGWWRGKLRNCVGLFPSNFVEELKEEKPAEQAKSPEELVNNSESLQTTPTVEIVTPIKNDAVLSAPEQSKETDSLETCDIPETTCSICWDEKIAVVFQCGHTIGNICYEELRRCGERGESEMNCHKCRSPVTNAIKLFL